MMGCTYCDGTVGIMGCPHHGPQVQAQVPWPDPGMPNQNPWPLVMWSPYWTWQPCDHCWCEDEPAYAEHAKCCKCGTRMHHKFVPETSR